jgi:hypothetical protein
MSVKIGNETFTTLDDYLNDEKHVTAEERAQIELEIEEIGKRIKDDKGHETPLEKLRAALRK